MKDIIRWGIIGCGDVTEVKSGPAFQRCDGSALVAVMRRDAGRAADYAKRHDVPRWYDDAQKLIDDPEVDAVYVATPPGSHMEYALRVAVAEKPCYVEKPMARSHGECARMIEAFDRAKQPLFVAYYRRALPRFVKVKERIDAGALGRVTGCRYRFIKRFSPNPTNAWRFNPEHSGGGLFLDIGSHVLDVLDHLLGPFVEYGGAASVGINSGVGVPPAHSRLEPQTRGRDALATDARADAPVEDVVSLHFRTDRGVVGSGDWNFASSRDEELLEIDGTEAHLSMGVLNRTPIELARRDGTNETFDIIDPSHVQQPLIQQVVNTLLGRGECASTGTSAARTSAVMDAALSSFYGGRDDAFWTRARTR